MYTEVITSHSRKRWSFRKNRKQEITPIVLPPPKQLLLDLGMCTTSIVPVHLCFLHEVFISCKPCVTAGVRVSCLLRLNNTPSSAWTVFCLSIFLQGTLGSLPPSDCRAAMPLLLLTNWRQTFLLGFGVFPTLFHFYTFLNFYYSYFTINPPSRFTRS